MSPSLKEDKHFLVFENKIVKKIFYPKIYEQTCEWRKLHNVELHILYGNVAIIRTLKSQRLCWAGHAAHIGDGRKAHKFLLRKLECKRPCGKLKIRWEDLKDVDYEHDWRTPRIG